MSQLLRGLTENHARTDPSARDTRLRGRTYAIPFEEVWTTASDLARNGMRGWAVVKSDDQEGTIAVESTTLLWRFVDDIAISIGLDDNGQTRVDLESASRKGKGDLGRNPRSIGRFLRRLDESLSVEPGQILDPTQAVAWRDGS